MQHNILFATDFSNKDQAAFKSACRLALKANARLIVLHVQDPRYEAFSAETRKDPKVEFPKYIPEDISVNFDHVVIVGDPPEEILKFADKENSDMIILGTHGRAGLNRVFVGSVAEKVLRNADIPVMTVRDAVENLIKHESPRILVPIDFSAYGYAAVDYATKLAISIGGTISIVHVDDAESPASRQFPNSRPEWSEHNRKKWEQLRKYVPQCEKVTFAHKLLKGEPAIAINAYANTHDYDFIVLGTHGRTGFGRAIMGSVAESVVRNSNSAVIAVKPSNKRSAAIG